MHGRDENVNKNLKLKGHLKELSIGRNRKTILNFILKHRL
jgi:hypothetical protein